MNLVLALAVLTAPPEPAARLHFAAADGRFVNRYAGNWRFEPKTGATTAWKEVGRSAEFVELKCETKIVRLTAAGVLTKTETGWSVPAAGAWTAAFTDADLGALSEKYESGGRGPGTVSTGIGDPGGVSYGTYQFASKIGRADEFVKQYYPKEFEGLKGGTPEFTAKWKALAEKDPVALHAKEHDYIRVSHYEPQVAFLKEAGFDVAQLSRVGRDCVWSTAVQHGPRSNVITAALKANAKPAEAEFLKAVYAERGRKSEDGKKLARFQRVSDSWIPGLTKRFESELADALAALEVK